MNARRTPVVIAAMCMMLLAQPQSLEARGFSSNRGSNSSRAHTLNRNHSRRIWSRGNYGRQYHQTAVRFEGRVIDPYKIGPTIDGVEIDIPRLTAAVQRRLSARGLYSGPVNGLRTDEFVRGLRMFQVEGSGRSSGQIDSSTIEDLGLHAAQFAK